jgi:hypothetical protein
MLGYDFVFSIGYRCSSAGILKSLGLKRESYPFDWMVSRLPIIQHCIKNDFVEFLDADNYTKKHSATYGYPTKIPNSRQWICDESILVNEYYLSQFLENDDDQTRDKMRLHLSEHLCAEHDSYYYPLMINHHDIKTEKDREYYERCIVRWKMLCKSSKKLSLYIHPMIFYEDAHLIPKIREEILEFHKNTFATDGIYIIIVKTPYTDPTNHCAKYVLEEQPDDESAPNCRICILWANRDFFDCGEIFSGNSFIETYVVKEYVKKTAEKGKLL